MVIKELVAFFLLLYLSAYKISIIHVNNESLIAMALLVAQSQPRDKNIIIKLILNLITED